MYYIKVLLWHLRQAISSLKRKQYPVGIKLEISWSNPNNESPRERAIQAFEDPHPRILCADAIPSTISENFSVEQERHRN